MDFPKSRSFVDREDTPGSPEGVSTTMAVSFVERLSMDLPSPFNFVDKLGSVLLVPKGFVSCAVAASPCMFNSDLTPFNFVEIFSAMSEKFMSSTASIMEGSPSSLFL